MGDVKGIEDLDPFGEEIDDIEATVQDSIRRLRTRRGTNPDDLDFGESAADWLSRPSTDVDAMRAEFAAEIAKDPRVSGADAAVEIVSDDQAGREARIDLAIEIDGAEVVNRTLVVNELGQIVEE